MKLFTVPNEPQHEDKPGSQMPAREILLDALDGSLNHNSLLSHYSSASHLVSGFKNIFIHTCTCCL